MAHLQPSDLKDKNINLQVHGGSSDAVYGLGLFGAWAWYIGRATTPEERIKGFFKGFAWPALMVYALFQFLNKD